MPVQTKSKTRISSFFEQDLFFKILLSIVWCNQILVRYVRAFMMRVPLVSVAVDVVLPWIYVVAVVLAIPYIVKKIKLSDVFLMLAIFLFGLISYVFYPENIDLLNEKFWGFVITVMPLYFIGVCIDIKRDYKLIYYLSIASIVGRLGYFFIIEGGVMGGDLLAGDMFASYILLPHVCIVLVAMLRKLSIVNFVVSLAGIIFIFSLGSRGPLICLLITAVVYLLFYKKFKHGFISRVVLIVIAFLAVVYFDSIIASLAEISSGLGMSTRVFDLFSTGDFLTSHGRDVISDTLYDALNENAIFGYGLYGDWRLAGVYAHSIYLELWVNYGLILGSGILLSVMALIINSMLKISQVKDGVEFLIPLIAFAFVKLFLSSSIMEEGNFFILIGVCVSIMRQAKVQSKENV